MRLLISARRHQQRVQRVASRRQTLLVFAQSVPHERRRAALCFPRDGAVRSVVVAECQRQETRLVGFHRNLVFVKPDDVLLDPNRKIFCLCTANQHQQQNAQQQSFSPHVAYVHDCVSFSLFLNPKSRKIGFCHFPS